MASTNYYYSTSSYPISVPQKPSHSQYPYNVSYQRPIAGSPPEIAESVATSGGPTFDPSATSSSYAGSASEYESSAGSATSVDLMDYMQDRLQGSFNPMPLDRSLAKQAQT